MNPLLSNSKASAPCRDCGAFADLSPSASKERAGMRRQRAGTAFGQPRDFLGNRFVYAVISARARGLSLGINLNPDKQCNFDCIYCEVDRAKPLGNQSCLRIPTQSNGGT